MIIGDSQVKRLNPEKLCNQYRDVEIIGQSGLRIKQAVAKAGETDKDVIIVHAGTNNLSTTYYEKKFWTLFKKYRRITKSRRLFFLQYPSALIKV